MKLAAKATNPAINCGVNVLAPEAGAILLPVATAPVLVGVSMCV